MYLLHSLEIKGFRKLENFELMQISSFCFGNCWSWQIKSSWRGKQGHLEVLIYKETQPEHWQTDLFILNPALHVFISLKIGFNTDLYMNSFC